MSERRRSIAKSQTKTPDELLRDLWEIRGQLRNNQELSLHDRHALGNTIEDAANYMAVQARQPSAQNTVQAQYALQNKAQVLLDDVKKTQESLIGFVEDNFDKVENHLRAIQLGGYAAFFGLWSITANTLHPIASALAALLMLVSVAIFSGWMIVRATVLSLCLKKAASQGLNPLEEFIIQWGKVSDDQQNSILKLTRYRWMAWLSSIIPAVLGVVLLMANFVYIIACPIF